MHVVNRSAARAFTSWPRRRRSGRIPAGKAGGECQFNGQRVTLNTWSQPGQPGTFLPALSSLSAEQGVSAVVVYGERWSVGTTNGREATPVDKATAAKVTAKLDGAVQTIGA